MSRNTTGLVENYFLKIKTVDNVEHVFKIDDFWADDLVLDHVEIYCKASPGASIRLTQKSSEIWVYKKNALKLTSL